MTKSANSNGTFNPYVVHPNEIQPDDRFGYKIIAIDFGYDWGAFKGLTDWSDAQVAANGDLIGKDTAEGLFPAFASLNKPYHY